MRARAASAACWKACSRASAGSRSWTARPSSVSPIRSAAAPSRWSRAASSSCPARRCETLHETCARDARRIWTQVNARRRAARHRLPRPRPQPELDARRDAGDAEVALRASWRTTCRRSARRGLDMMFRTCTVQVNLDFADEADMVQEAARRPGAAADRHRALRQLALHRGQARTASCPSARRSGATPTTHRTGMLPVRLRERHRLRALCRLGARRADVFRQARRHLPRRRRAPPSATCSTGTLPQLPGERATISDWANHLSTLFPEVRLKSYLEMRGADAGLADMLVGAAGLLGRAALRPGVAGRRVAAGEGLDRRGAAGAARRRAPARWRPRSAAARCSTSPARQWRCRARGSPGGRVSTRRPGRDHPLAALEEIAATGRARADDLLARYESGVGPLGASRSSPPTSSEAGQRPERRDPRDGVLAAGRVGAGLGLAGVAGREGQAAPGHDRRRPGRVEIMHGALIGDQGRGAAGRFRLVDEPAAALRRRPVVVLAHQDQQRQRGACSCRARPGRGIPGRTPPRWRNRVRRPSRRGSSCCP